MIPVVLLILGLFLILIEFYVPGAIMGILGTLLMLISIVLFAYQSQSPWAIGLFVFVAIICLILMIRFALWRIVRAKPGHSIYSHGDQKGYIASSFDIKAIGKMGTVLSDLKPGGYIVVDGKQHQAISISGYISKGDEVVVVAGEGESLLVKNKRLE